MKILFFGDIFGRPGREGVARQLPKLQAEYAPDFVLANVENATHGRGPSERHLRELLALGLDGFTSGNHIFDGTDGLDLAALPADFPLVRPANYPPGVPGHRFFVLEKNGHRLFVTNLLGRVFLAEGTDSPFRAAEELLTAAAEAGCRHILVDFHAEATSEKTMLGYYLAGRASAVVGTHTHVQTADEQILRGGTAYISDVGFCGPHESIIGAEIAVAQQRFLTAISQPLAVAAGPAVVSAVVIQLDDATGRATGITRVREVVA